MTAGARPRALVAVGASAGGIEGLRYIVSRMPEDFDGALFVVLHLAPAVPSVLPDILQRAGPLPVPTLEDEQPLVAGTVYVAPPDHHMCVVDDTVRLNRDAKINGHRPAIDALFESAATAYGPATVGVLLSGMLSDGVAGLAAIRAAGGHTAVQDPEETAFPSMALAAIREGVAEAIHDLDGLVEWILKAAAAVGNRLRLVVDPPDGGAPGRGAFDPPDGELSGLTCPNCGGSLWQRELAGQLQYRCRTGHTYGEDALLDVQVGALDDALWGAHRALLEHAELTRRIARRMEDIVGDAATAARYRRLSSEADRRAAILHELLTESGRHQGHEVPWTTRTTPTSRI